MNHNLKSKPSGGWSIQKYKEPAVTPRYNFYDNRIEKYVTMSVAELSDVYQTNDASIGGFIISDGCELKIQYALNSCGVLGHIIVEDFFPILSEEENKILDINTEKENTEESAKKLFNYILNSNIDFTYNRKHYQKKMGDIIRLLAYYRTGWPIYIPKGYDGTEFGKIYNCQEIANTLSERGIRVYDGYILIPYRHRELSSLLKNAGHESKWNKTLENLPNVEKEVQAYFCGKNLLCIKIPLNILV